MSHLVEPQIKQFEELNHSFCIPTHPDQVAEGIEVAWDFDEYGMPQESITLTHDDFLEAGVITESQFNCEQFISTWTPTESDIIDTTHHKVSL